MATTLGIAFSCVLCCVSLSQALAASTAVIPNGGAGVGSLSIIDPATGMIERNLVTAVAPAQPTSLITNYNFAITDSGASAAVIGLEQNPTSAVYFLSAVDLSTGRITAQQELPFVLRKLGALVAANPKADVLYLGYGDQSGNFHIQALNPITLHQIQESNLGAYQGQSMIVSPDGQTIYVIASGEVVAVAASNLKLIGTVSVAASFNVAISPDSSTLYVPAGAYPNMTVAVIDTATLVVTESVPISEVSVVFGLAISPDGSQLYLAGQANFQGTDVFTLDLATEALSSVSVVVNGDVVVSPSGTVYVANSMNNILEGSGVLVFDPVSQSVTGTLSVYGYGVLALNSTGNRLYYLNQQSSTLAATGAPPSETILDTAATGFLESTAYDATNNLLLAADIANNIEVLDASTFAPAGHLFLPNLTSTPPYLNASGGSGFVTMDGDVPEVLRFDPAALKVTGKAPLPNRPQDLVYFSQPVMDGSTLYVPFSFTFNGGPIQSAGSASDVSNTIPKNGVAVIDTQQMKVLAVWPFPALPLLGVAPGASVGYAVFAAGGQELVLEEIELSTGKVVASVQVPGIAPNYSNPAVSLDGSTVYLFSANTLYTFNSATLAITNQLTGVGLTNLTVSPDGSYLYGGTPAPCQMCSEQIISTSSLEVVGTIPLSTGYPQPVLFIGN